MLACTRSHRSSGDLAAAYEPAKRPGAQRAFAATGLARVLLSTTPDALRVFTRITLLITAITAVLPLKLDVDTSSRAATAVLNACIGIAIVASLRGGVRRSTT